MVRVSSGFRVLASFFFFWGGGGEADVGGGTYMTRVCGILGRPTLKHTVT